MFSLYTFIIIARCLERNCRTWNVCIFFLLTRTGHGDSRFYLDFLGYIYKRTEYGKYLSFFTLLIDWLTRLLSGYILPKCESNNCYNIF